MTVLWDWCASPSATANLPFRSPQANWKAECDESRPLRLEGGKDCKVLPILTPRDPTGSPGLPYWPHGHGRAAGPAIPGGAPARPHGLRRVVIEECVCGSWYHPPSHA
jgi:hypothetical protein